jgi:CRP-like cAMP-binding protein
LVDFKHWFREAFGKHTPWGDEDSPALVTEVESSLERELSRTLMRAHSKPTIRRIAKGQTLTEQGEEATDLYLLLDGVLSVEVDGQPLADVGPGAILGERALLGEHRRTSTLRAATPCKVAVVNARGIEEGVLAEIAGGHRREEAL